MTPVVLHHGFLGFGVVRVGAVSVSSFMGIDRALSDRGYPVIVTQVHPTAAIERRAAQLKRLILDQLGGMGRRDERVIVVAHSMGGLDARYMVSRLGMEERVAAVVTVSSPHAGSSYAEWCLRNLSRVGAMRAFKLVGLDVGALPDLTREAVARFNEEVPDVPGIRYYSVSAARPWKKISPLLLPSWKIIYREEGENDGLVSVKSARYGEHLGTWEMDHWHVINKRVNLEWPGRAVDVRPRYVEVVARVTREVEEDLGKSETRNPKFESSSKLEGEKSRGGGWRVLD